MAAITASLARIYSSCLDAIFRFCCCLYAAHKQLISLGVLSMHLFPLVCSIALGKNGKISLQLIQLLTKLVFLRMKKTIYEELATSLFIIKLMVGIYAIASKPFAMAIWYEQAPEKKLSDVVHMRQILYDCIEDKMMEHFVAKKKNVLPRQQQYKC